MNEWKKVRFLDVVHLNPRISLEKGVEYPFVEMSNVVPCARKPEKDVFKKYLGEGTKFEQGDTIVARIEPCLQNGKGFQCSYKQGFGSTEFLVFRPVNINDLDCDFLYYYMGQQSIREAMAKTMVGASGRQRVNNKVFNDLQINLPPLSTQHRIASILSRYDSLIENYQKQIKLLGEAAQRLYKEWFVDLHFPGHENTNIVDGVPEGWEKKKLHKIAEVVMGSSPKSEFYNNDKQGLPFHQGVGSYGTRFVDDNVYSTSITRLAEPNSILFSVRAPVGRLNITKNKIIIGRGLAAMNHKDGFQSFLFYMLKERFFMDNIIGNGSIFASISKVELLDQEFIVPPMKTIKAFESLASKLDKKIQGVDTQLHLLTEARDRLLPKLMSGEITI